jgi:hypothetical protein
LETDLSFFQNFEPLFSNVDSQKVCIPGKTYANATLARGDAAGKYRRLGEVKNVQQCIEKVCSTGKGDIVQVIDKYCYVIECNDMESCEKVGLPFYSRDLRFILVDMKWKGKIFKKVPNFDFF